MKPLLIQNSKIMIIFDGKIYQIGTDYLIKYDFK